MRLVWSSKRFIAIAATSARGSPCRRVVLAADFLFFISSVLHPPCPSPRHSRFAAVSETEQRLWLALAPARRGALSLGQEREETMTDYGNFIAGEWTKGADAGPNINPSNVDDVIGHYAKADKHQAEGAIAAAKAAFTAWARTTPQQRADILDAVGNAIIARKEELGTLLSREEGKTKPEGIGEAARAGAIFKFM